MTEKPSGLSSDRDAAVQLAIWHYSDNLDISTGGTPSAIFNAARNIIADTDSNYLKTYALSFDPLSASCKGSEITIRAKLTFDNGPVAGKIVSFIVTGSNSATGTATTDSNGYATFKYTPIVDGTDTITATVQSIIPAGVIWVSQDHQSLVSAKKNPLSKSVSVSINPCPVVSATGAAICEGDTAHLVGSVTTENCAAGSTLTYKWYRVEGSSETSLTDGSKYTGTDTLTLNILDAVPADAGTYRLKVTCSGTQCTGVADAVLSITSPVVSATGTAVCAGNTAHLVGSVTTENCAAGSTLTYKWYRVEGSSETSLTDGSKYTGTGTLTLNILDAVTADAGTYRLKVTCSGTQCTGVADAVLSVGSPVVSATGTAVCAGNTAHLVGSVTTENCAAGSTLTYKWYRVEGSSETSLTDGSKYTGTGTLTLNILNAVSSRCRDLQTESNLFWNAMHRCSRRSSVGQPVSCSLSNRRYSLRWQYCSSSRLSDDRELCCWHPDLQVVPSRGIF